MEGKPVKMNTHYQPWDRPWMIAFKWIVLVPLNALRGAALAMRIHDPAASQPAILTRWTAGIVFGVVVWTAIFIGVDLLLLRWKHHRPSRALTIAAILRLFFQLPEWLDAEACLISGTLIFKLTIDDQTILVPFLLTFTSGLIMVVGYGLVLVPFAYVCLWGVERVRRRKV
ncbi:hypothetical protein JW905_01320 [bacterium]|nr:hypothetical protein [candidate division CSSED10-310 bacterium]